MKALSIQIQPKREPGSDESLVVARLKTLVSESGLVQRFRVDEGSEDGRWVNLTYTTDNLSALWFLIRKEVLADEAIGPTAKRTMIVVCQGDTGWDDYLLLHHFNEQEPLDSLGDQ